MMPFLLWSLFRNDLFWLQTIYLSVPCFIFYFLYFIFSVFPSWVDITAFILTSIYLSVPCFIFSFLYFAVYLCFLCWHYCFYFDSLSYLAFITKSVSVLDNHYSQSLCLSLSWHNKPVLVLSNQCDQIWRKFATLVNFLKVFGPFLEALFSMWQNIEPT